MKIYLKTSLDYLLSDIPEHERIYKIKERPYSGFRPPKVGIYPPDGFGD